VTYSNLLYSKATSTYLHFYYFIGINVGKAHLLSTIINNIEMQGNYYQKATLDYVIKESDPLFNRFEEKGNTIINYLRCIDFLF